MKRIQLSATTVTVLSVSFRLLVHKHTLNPETDLTINNKTKKNLLYHQEERNGNNKPLLPHLMFPLLLWEVWAHQFPQRQNSQ